jgi:hypothetical protein
LLAQPADVVVVVGKSGLLEELRGLPDGDGVRRRRDGIVCKAGIVRGRLFSFVASGISSMPALYHAPQP